MARCYKNYRFRSIEKSEHLDIENLIISSVMSNQRLVESFIILNHSTFIISDSVHGDLFNMYQAAMMRVGSFHEIEIQVDSASNQNGTPWLAVRNKLFMLILPRYSNERSFYLLCISVSCDAENAA